MKHVVFVCAIMWVLPIASFAVSNPSTDSGKIALKPVQDTVKKTPPRKSFEEEDILIDETEEKKLAPEKIAEKKPAAAIKKNDSLLLNQQKSASVADSQKIVAPVEERKTDSTAVSSTTDTAITNTAKKSEAAPEPVVIDSIRSINFAKNLKDYRSPKLAMFLSLLVPGLGQAYVKRYYKTGIFVAIEATAIGFSLAYSSKGKRQNDDAKAFAEANYKADTMVNYYNKLIDFISRLPISGGDPDTAKAIVDNIFFDSSLVAFKQAHATRSQEFYRDIESNIYVQGWKDCQPTLNQISNNMDTTFFAGGRYKYRVMDSVPYQVYRIDTAKGTEVVVDSMIYGYSEKQKEFTLMMSKSNSNYKTAQRILFSMIINHVLSAVDALISAKAYNDELIGKESLWQHLTVEQQMVDAGSHSVPGIALRFRF